MTSIQRLTKESEERISAALSEVADLTSAGEHPNDAIVKIASQRQLPAGHVRLMVRAFNNGRTLGHFRNHDTLQEKAASFPLADASEVLERMFPSEVASNAEKTASTAIASDYTMSPQGWLHRRNKAVTGQRLLEKAASADKQQQVSDYPDNPLRAGRKAISKIADYRREHTRVKDAAIKASYKVASAVSEVGEYFRRPDAYDAGEVKANAAAHLGPPAAKLLDHAATFTKRAADSPQRMTHRVDWAQPPYSLVKSAIDAMHEFIEKRAALEQFENELPQRTAETLRPFGKSGPSVIVGSVWDNHSPTKQASVAGFGLAGLAGGLSRGLGSKLLPASREELVQKKLKELGSPDHEDKLRAIRAQTMMHELMAADPVISGHPQEDVIEAFNHLSEVAPRAMQQRVMARALVRKYLEQAANVDPFDIDQLLDVEEKIQQRDMPAALAANQYTGPSRELGPPVSKPQGYTTEAPSSSGVISEIKKELRKPREEKGKESRPPKEPKEPKEPGAPPFAPPEKPGKPGESIPPGPRPPRRDYGDNFDTGTNKDTGRRDVLRGRSRSGPLEAKPNK